MPSLLWDASALLKRYYLEAGSDTIDCLFRLADLPPMFVTISGFAETFAILVRKRNAKLLGAEGFREATRLLHRDVFIDGIIRATEVGYHDVMDSPPLIETHNINSSDAAILASFSRYASARPASYLFCSSDRRLIRAAGREAFETFNPESVSPEELPDFLRRLQ